jgi:hypothetical protein
MGSAYQVLNNYDRNGEHWAQRILARRGFPRKYLRPMPAPAMRAAFVTANTTVEAEKRSIIFPVAFRATPAPEEHPTRNNAAKGKIGKQRQGTQNVNYQPP